MIFFHYIILYNDVNGTSGTDRMTRMAMLDGTSFTDRRGMRGHGPQWQVWLLDRNDICRGKSS